MVKKSAKKTEKAKKDETKSVKKGNRVKGKTERLKQAEKGKESERVEKDVDGSKKDFSEKPKSPKEPEKHAEKGLKGPLLFGRWNTAELTVKDPGLKKYINVDPVMAPVSRGRHAKKQFYKSHINIIERLITRLYVAGHRGKKHRITSGKNIGKSQKLWKLVLDALKIVEEKTKKNPIQVFINAIENAAPMEEVISYQRGGVLARKAVIISPQRRIDLSIRMIVQGAYEKRLGEGKGAENVLAQEIIGAYNNDRKCKAIRDKERREKEAEGAR